MMNKLNLKDLERGYIGITETVGAYLAEAAFYCLSAQGFSSGIKIQVDGFAQEELAIFWKNKKGEQLLRAWRDSLEATEYGAVGVTILLIEAMTNLEVIERAYIGGGFDYILGSKMGNNNDYQKVARLEVSGIWKETRGNSVENRVRLKLKQIEKSSDMKLKAYISVIEFSTPKAKIIIQ